jgi:hypothetical protein
MEGRKKAKKLLFDFVTINSPAECESSDGTWNERCAGMLINEGDGETEETSDHPEDPAKAWFPKYVERLHTGLRGGGKQQPTR